MFKRLLIANRGEISCRIARTCRAMGIEAVAVFSDADRFAKHVREADFSVRLGPGPAAESYLNQKRIIAAAMETGAEAIHPGYGFLSENPEFAERVDAAGLAWIGPTAETIRALGLKDQAKTIAEDAGVPVLPGYRGAAQDLETLSEEATRIGFPLLIKAVAGGGGRGIREVRSLEELGPQLESAVREAEGAFGDGRVMLEKLVEQPRHIEVQVFGDGKGGAVHLFERDCSLQRRRQKLVEEAPAPGMDAKTRKAMTDAAVKLAKAVKYCGAGTVEFIVDGKRPLAPDTFFFLEMNTRLQVEHPVTEMVTGTDLVEWQIRLAAGEGLPARQSEITLDGHAIECRICAEDPSDGFRPGAGRLELFEPSFDPEITENVRWETGFETGDTVPAIYDSMIAKLVVFEPTRGEAIETSAEILAHTQLIGTPQNIGFLLRCLRSETFADGTHHVNWIGEAGTALSDVPDGVQDAALWVSGDYLVNAREGYPGGPFGVRDGFRMNAAPRGHVQLRASDSLRSVDVLTGPNENWPSAVLTPLSERRFAVTALGETVQVARPDFEAEAEALGTGDAVTAPMPGKLLSVAVKAGDMVAKGDAVAVMEAMKMEHTLSAPRDGTIETVTGEAGAQLAEGEVIVSLVEE